MPSRATTTGRRRCGETGACSHRGVGDEVHVEAIFDPVGGATFTAAWDRVDNELRLADEQGPDTPLRTPAQRRLDALVEMAIRATTNGAAGGGRVAAGHGRGWQSQLPPAL